MNAKHTTGPWEVCNGTDVFPASDFNARKHIADCDPNNAPVGNIAGAYAHPDTDMTYEEAMANAHLMAASPDLLLALKGMVGMYVDLVESGDAGFWDAEKVSEVISARAAIAKAERK